jgi:hypothetical protein
MERIRLEGGLDRTASWAYMDEQGRLVVECFDFSEDAHDYFGNDVAFTLTVDAESKASLLERLGGTAEDDVGLDESILRALAGRFTSYFDVRAWLEAEGIAFRSAFDPHA